MQKFAVVIHVFRSQFFVFFVFVLFFLFVCLFFFLEQTDRNVSTYKTHVRCHCSAHKYFVSPRSLAVIKVQPISVQCVHCTEIFKT